MTEREKDLECVIYDLKQQLRVLEARWKAIHDGDVYLEPSWDCVNRMEIFCSLYASFDGKTGKYYTDMRDFDMDLDEYILEKKNGATA